MNEALPANHGFMNTARIIVNTRAETTIMSTVYLQGFQAECPGKTVSVQYDTPALACDENNDVVNIAKRAS